MRLTCFLFITIFCFVGGAQGKMVLNATTLARILGPLSGIVPANKNVVETDLDFHGNYFSVATDREEDGGLFIEPIVQVEKYPDYYLQERKKDRSLALKKQQEEGDLAAAIQLHHELNTSQQGKYSTSIGDKDCSQQSKEMNIPHHRDGVDKKSTGQYEKRYALAQSDFNQRRAGIHYPSRPKEIKEKTDNSTSLAHARIMPKPKRVTPIHQVMPSYKKVYPIAQSDFNQRRAGIHYPSRPKEIKEKTDNSTFLAHASILPKPKPMTPVRRVIPSLKSIPDRPLVTDVPSQSILTPEVESLPKRLFAGITGKRWRPSFEVKRLGNIESPKVLDIGVEKNSVLAQICKFDKRGSTPLKADFSSVTLGNLSPLNPPKKEIGKVDKTGADTNRFKRLSDRKHADWVNERHKFERPVRAPSMHKANSNDGTWINSDWDNIESY